MTKCQFPEVIFDADIITIEELQSLGLSITNGQASDDEEQFYHFLTE